MNDLISLKNIFEGLGGSQVASIWEIGLRILILGISLFIISKTLPFFHKKLTFFKFYQNWYDHYRGWLYFIVIGIISLIFLSQLQQLSWESTLIFGGAALLSLGLSFREVLINIIAYPIVQRMIRSKQGDYVEFGKYNGLLIKQGLTHFSLQGESAKKIIIPNRKILTETFLSTEKQNVHHFTVEFPVVDTYKNNLSKLLELCHEIILLSAYHSLQQPPEIDAILKNGELWLTCKCYTNRKKNLSPYRTFLLTELAEKTNILGVSDTPAIPLLKEKDEILSRDKRPHQLKYGDIEKTVPSGRRPSSNSITVEQENETIPGVLETLYDPSDESEVIDNHSIEQPSVEPSSAGHPNETTNKSDLQGGPPQGDPPQHTISEIENLEDMDLLYKYAMSTNPDQATAAMVAIERMQQKVEEQPSTILDKKDLSPEKTSIRLLSVGQSPAKEVIPKKQVSSEKPSVLPSETTEHANELDQLYELALSDDPEKADAAMKSIERIHRELITKHFPQPQSPVEKLEKNENSFESVTSDSFQEANAEEEEIHSDENLERQYHEKLEDRSVDDHLDEVLLLKQPESDAVIGGSLPKQIKETSELAEQLQKALEMLKNQSGGLPNGRSSLEISKTDSSGWPSAELEQLVGIVEKAIGTEFEDTVEVKEAMQFIMDQIYHDESAEV